MRKIVAYKFGCCVMVGLLMPLSVAQASDDANDRIQAHLGDASMQATNFEPLASPIGAQGPIRSDMTEDKPAETDSAAKQPDNDLRMFPHPDGA